MSDVEKVIKVSKEVDEVCAVFVDMVLEAHAGKIDVLSSLSKLIAHLGALASLPAEVRSNSVDAAEAAALQAVRLIAGLLNAPKGD